jgi:predicted RNA-binding protein with PUA-like domain
MGKQCWLIKSEPFKFPFSQLLKDGVTAWDGVRNYEARNNLRAMKAGDLTLFYHSSEGKEVVGVARVKREAYQDPTTEEDWSAVDFEPVCPLSIGVTLAAIKADPKLGAMALVRKPRISVVPVTSDEFKAVLALGKTKLPAGASK